MSQLALNAARAIALKRKMTWRQVGIALAEEAGRPVAYGASAVAKAVKVYRA